MHYANFRTPEKSGGQFQMVEFLRPNPIRATRESPGQKFQFSGIGLGFSRSSTNFRRHFEL
jgi:hypothetical protein